MITETFNMADRLPLSFLYTVFLLLILCGGTATSYDRPPPDIISDGVHNGSVAPPLLLLLRSSDCCDQSYGFMPCSTTVLGNLFLIIIYGHLMFHAATFLSNGSELLMVILGPGIVGGLILPVLGALPEAMLVLVSGLSGNIETAREKISVGMGLVAGTTVVVLTLTWGTCIVVGKCDLQDSIAKDGEDTKGFSLTGSGVSTDIWTTYAAKIMAASVIPFLVVQLPQVMHSTSGRHLAVLFALIVSLSLLVSYCIYQVFQPWIQKRRLAYAKHRHLISRILRHLKMRTIGRLLKDDGEPNIEVIRKLFTSIDGSGSGSISTADLRALIVGIQFNEFILDEDAAVEKVMKDFDTSGDSKIDLFEFIVGISKWLNEAKRSGPSVQAVPDTTKYLDEFHLQTKKEHDLLGDQNDEIVEGVENPKWNTSKAVLLMLLGTLIVVAFADPLVDAVDNFSDATSIPSFLVSFVVLPFATSSGEAASAITYFKSKKKRSASLTLSELYGVVTMKILLCLSVFLALVYMRGLTWDFSSEVVVILVVCIVMGAFVCFRTTFPLWTSFVAFLLYPFSLALLYVLHNSLRWS